MEYVVMRKDGNGVGWMGCPLRKFFSPQGASSTVAGRTGQEWLLYPIYIGKDSSAELASTPGGAHASLFHLFPSNFPSCS